MSREYAETLPEDLRDWLDQKAAELDTDRDDVLVRAVAAYRLVDENHERLAETGPDDLADRLSTLDDRVAAVETDLDEKVEDVRRRVIQVKGESDAKAPADHEHPELAALEERLGGEERAVGELWGRVSTLEADVDAGFDNFESILEYLAETTDELSERVERLARAVVDARIRVGELESVAAERAAVAQLQSEANRAGATAARCGECDAPVEIGLLAAPECPHCNVTFGSLEPARGFFGSATLLSGNRPALEGAEDPVESPADLIGEESRRSATDVIDGGDDE